jgi:hypothetical protein
MGCCQAGKITSESKYATTEAREQMVVQYMFEKNDAIFAMTGGDKFNGLASLFQVFLEIGELVEHYMLDK